MLTLDSSTETWHVPSDWTVADVGRDLGRLVELTRHTSHWTWVTAPESIDNRHGGDCVRRWSLKTCVGVQPLGDRLRDQHHRSGLDHWQRRLASRLVKASPALLVVEGGLN